MAQKTRLSSKHTHFRPTVFKLLATDDKLTAASGLATIMEVFDQSPLSQGFKDALPSRISNHSIGSYRLGLIQLNSFLYGHECLDDLDEFRDDPLLEAVMKGEVAAPRTMGDFLRDFEEEHLQKMNRYLSKMSRMIRKQLQQIQPEEYRPKELCIDIDSTFHEHTGEKMEGLAWNYKNQWGLESQVAFDEWGFCHGVQLRPGNTKSGVDANQLIDQVFHGLKYEREKKFRADSAYCTEAIIHELEERKVKFTITAHDSTTQWKSQLDQIQEWKAWLYTNEQIQKAKDQERQLAKIEIAQIRWQPSWNSMNPYWILIKRTRKEIKTTDVSNSSGEWDYYAVATNVEPLDTLSLGTIQRSPEQTLMEFHQARGNAERFIREEKYGYDLQHFPCQSLKANYASLLIGMIAHNILRWIALIQRPDKPHFSKKIRRRFVYIPGKVIFHARQHFLKIPLRFYNEIHILEEAWSSTEWPSLDFY
jgi:hypothetical protein